MGGERGRRSRARKTSRIPVRFEVGVDGDLASIALGGGDIPTASGHICGLKGPSARHAALCVRVITKNCPMLMLTTARLRRMNQSGRRTSMDEIFLHPSYHACRMESRAELVSQCPPIGAEPHPPSRRPGTPGGDHSLDTLDDRPAGGGGVGSDRPETTGRAGRADGRRQTLATREGLIQHQSTGGTTPNPFRSHASARKEGPPPRQYGVDTSVQKQTLVRQGNKMAGVGR
jgi:hypothetical protein